MPKSLPNTQDLLQWLAEHPAALEPGLVFYQGPLELSRGLEVALHGVDPLGRPCVVHAPKEIDAGAIEWMVEVVAGLRAEAKHLTRWYTRASEPRVFLITQHLKRPERERLALLADAFPLRVFSWEWSNEKDAAPSFLLELPLPGEHFLQALEGLDEEIRRPGQRILYQHLAAFHCDRRVGVGNRRADNRRTFALPGLAGVVCRRLLCCLASCLRSTRFRQSRGHRPV